MRASAVARGRRRADRRASHTGTDGFHLRRYPTYEVPSETRVVAAVSPVLRGLDELDVKKREISVWRKFRGIGDCGLSARYAVDGGKVRVLDIRAKVACDGEPAEGARMRRLPVPVPTSR